MNSIRFSTRDPCRSLRSKLSCFVLGLAIVALPFAPLLNAADIRPAAVVGEVSTGVASAQPILLIPVDGAPRLAPFGAFYRVINTQALIVLDPATGMYYLRALDAWYRAAAVTGPWALETNPPARLADVLTAAERNDGIDLLEPIDGGPSYDTVTILVTTQTTVAAPYAGPICFLPIPNSELLYAANTVDPLYFCLSDHCYYFHDHRRWYCSDSYTSGPWTCVTRNQLPRPFEWMPDNDRLAHMHWLNRRAHRSPRYGDHDFHGDDQRPGDNRHHEGRRADPDNHPSPTSRSLPNADGRLPRGGVAPIQPRFSLAPVRPAAPRDGSRHLHRPDRERTHPPGSAVQPPKRIRPVDPSRNRGRPDGRLTHPPRSALRPPDRIRPDHGASGRRIPTMRSHAPEFHAPRRSASPPRPARRRMRPAPARPSASAPRQPHRSSRDGKRRGRR